MIHGVGTAVSLATKAVPGGISHRLRLRHGVRLSRAVPRARRRPHLGGNHPGSHPIGLMDLLLQDLRYSLRLLAKSKLLGGVAVLSLALAIGANSAMFSVVYTVLLRPLAYSDSERLVMLWGSRTDDRSNRNGVAGSDFRDYPPSKLRP